MRLLALILMLSARLAFASVAEDFASANEAYSKKDFASAISTYESLVRRGEYRPEIFYNLGLAYEQSANPAHAVLNFERALLLSPSFSEAQAHRDALSPRPTVWWEQTPRFGSTASLVAGVVGFWCFLLALVARWRVLGGTRNLWGAAAAIGLVVALIAAASLFYRDLPSASPNRAIVLKPEKLRSNFTEGSGSLSALTPGQSVEITSVNGPWTNCFLPDQTRGWVATESLERIVPTL